MSVRWPLFVAVGMLLGTTAPLPAQSETPSTNARGARTIAFHPRDLIALYPKLHYTTLIVLPDGEDVVEATCGDKEFWIVNARGPLVSVKPAKAGSETNLNLVTTSGRVYAFVLTEVSAVKGRDPDLTAYLEFEDAVGTTATPNRPKYVLADQVNDFRAQAELARDDARRAIETARAELEKGLTGFRTTYPLGLRFTYRFKPDVSPFFVHIMFHDDHLTYIQARAPELPSLYELKDGMPNLVNFDVRDGTYIVPKILDSGYLMVGKRRFAFQRVNAQ
jgi:hypothetical protein